MSGLTPDQREFRDALTDACVRAADQVTVYICNLDGRDPRDHDDAPDPADVHEDIREMLWPFFEEIRHRVEGPECSSHVKIGTNAYAKCLLFAGHEGPCEPCVGSTIE